MAAAAAVAAPAATLGSGSMAATAVSGYPRSTTMVNSTPFVCSSRYRIIKPIGSGAYGTVVSAEDLATGKRVAIKRVGDAYRDLIDAKRILREIKLMRHFAAHENLVALADLEEPPSLAVRCSASSDVTFPASPHCACALVHQSRRATSQCCCTSYLNTAPCCRCAAVL